MTISKVLTSVICLFLTLSGGVTDDEICSYYLYENVEYTTADSLLQFPYFGGDLSAPRMGWRYSIGGVNTNGTIFIVGGTYAYDITDRNSTPGVVAANRWILSTNVYNGWIAYDDTVEKEFDWSVQEESWNVGFGIMPGVTPPSGVRFPSAYTSSSGSFQCQDGRCYTNIDDTLYIVNPTFIPTSGSSSTEEWPVMIKFHMNDENPYYESEDDFASELPYNYYDDPKDHTERPFDEVLLGFAGCTTNNKTHVFHFNAALETEEKINATGWNSSFPSTFAYDIANDEWSLLSGHPWEDKYRFGCGSSVDGRYIYLIGGVTIPDWGIEAGFPSNPTDRYDTWTDTWTRLNNDNQTYPESVGRAYARVITDATTNRLIIMGGFLADNGNTYGADKIEQFLLDEEAWVVAEDVTEEVYLGQAGGGITVVKVDDFQPNGERSNASADMMFIFGGGKWDDWYTAGSIQFLSVLTEREYYPDNNISIVYNIETGWPNNPTYDAYQRFEIPFRIVFTDGVEELWPTNDTGNWSISFEIDGKPLAQIEQEYDVNFLTRLACICYDKDCLNMPDNVRQVVNAELLIPSRRPNNNGYCADDDPDTWIFRENSNATITAHVWNDGTEMARNDFVFEFASIELDEIGELDRERVEKGLVDPDFLTRGCYVSKPAENALTNFEIQCQGFVCEGCVQYKGIGRSKYDLNEEIYVEYNVLMDDVLLSPDNWAFAGTNDTIVGTASLNPDSLIAVARVETTFGTYYSKCFKNDGNNTVFNFTDDWSDHEASYTAVVDMLNSGDIEDVVAAYSILSDQIENDEIPDGEDPKSAVTNALTVLLDTTDTTDITIEEIEADISLINLLTSNPDLVDEKVALNLSGSLIPQLLNKTVELLVEQEEQNPDLVSSLADTIQTVGSIANNAVSNIITNVNSSNLTEQAKQQAIEDQQELMKISLTGAWNDEVIIRQYEGVTIFGTPTTENNCFQVTFPPQPNVDVINCVVTEVEGEDPIKAVDLFYPDGTKVFQTNDSCYPFLISMNIPSKYIDEMWTMLSNGSWYNTTGIDYPTCTFWNSTEEDFSGEGCFVYRWDEDTVTCACTHLTNFKLSAEHFDPKADLITMEDWRDLNVSNIKDHPITWVTMLMIVVVLSVACICVPNNNADKPIIAFEDIIYKEFRDQYLHKHQQWHEIQQIDRWYSKIAQVKREMSISGQGHDNSDLNGSPLFGQVSSPSSPSSRKIASYGHTKRRQGKYYCLLSVNLFKTYLKNDHTVLSVFQRTDGTNFSTKQRIGLFLLYMYFIMLADAIFYGRQHERKPFGGLTSSALISLIGTAPVYLIRVLFQWAKPRIVKSAKSRNGSMHEPLMQDASTEEQDISKQGGLIEMNSNAASNVTSPSGGDTVISPSPYSPEDGQSIVVLSPSGSTLPTTSPQEEESASYEDEMKDEEYLRRTGQIHDTNMKRRLSNTYWSAIAELKKTSRPDMKLVRKCMHYVNTKANAAEKASLASEIRLILFNYNYPFPHWYKKMAWAILIILCIICVVFSVMYGIQFDLKSEESEAHNSNLQDLQTQVNATLEENEMFCNLSRMLHATEKLLNEQIEDEQNAQNEVLDIMEDYPDTYPGDHDSTKWLLNVLISFLTSVFIWQPLAIYMLTWIKVWAFHNGLIMEASVYNMWLFLCCCCYKNQKKKHSNTKTMLELSNKKSIGSDDTTDIVYDDDGNNRKGKKPKVSYVPEESEVYELSVSGSGFAAVGNEDRALDVIGFLCNDELFVELPDDFESSYEQ